MEGRYVELAGVRLFFLDSGGPGPVVVFLHANTGTSDSWEPQLEAFAAAGYRAIAFDARGYGRSTVRSGPSSTPTSVAEDLHGLAELLALDTFHLVATARGGFWAIDYAAWKPERVASLVLAATIGFPDEPEIKEFAARIRVEPLWAHELAAALELSPTYRGKDPGGTRRWMEIHERAHQQGAAGQLLLTPNTYAKLSSLTLPVLALAGGADLVAPPALMERWVARLSDVEFVVVAAAGHSVAWEEPERFNELVLGFLARH